MCLAIQQVAMSSMDSVHWKLVGVQINRLVIIFASVHVCLCVCGAPLERPVLRWQQPKHVETYVKMYENTSSN